MRTFRLIAAVLATTTPPSADWALALAREEQVAYTLSCTSAVLGGRAGERALRV